MARLDVELVNRKIFNSRARAAEEIKNGIVFCNNNKITKCSYNVKNEDIITIIGEKIKYVSRGGLKLEKALKTFNIILNNKNMLDIGASTGGFTDCALQNNINSVICIDVGKNQLDNKIKNNDKVRWFENTDFREISIDILKNINIVVIDISFISITKILNKLKEIAHASEVIALIKPQFECGKSVSKKHKGIVNYKEIHIEAINNVINEFKNIGYELINITNSPIKGGNGNIEYLAYFIKNETNSNITKNDIEILVKSSLDNKQTP